MSPGCYLTINKCSKRYSVVSAADGYGEDDVLYVWTHGADRSIKMAPDMKLSQYDLVGLSAGNTTAMSAGKIRLTFRSQ